MINKTPPQPPPLASQQRPTKIAPACVPDISSAVGDAAQALDRIPAVHSAHHFGHSAWHHEATGRKPVAPMKDDGAQV